MHVDEDVSMESVVLVVDLVELVGGGEGVEEAMGEVEHHVVQVVDNHDVESELLELWETVKSHLHALQVGNVDESRVND